MRNPPGLANAEFEANIHGRVMAGVTSPAEFLSEENVGRILAGHAERRSVTLPGHGSRDPR
jgi:hypothetical protein